MLEPPSKAAAVLACVALSAIHGCRERPETPVARVTGGAVAAGTPEATRVGRDILARGGNAADAAVAVSLALAVTEPGQSGLGGTAVALVRPPGAAPVVIHVPGIEPVGPGPGNVAAPALLPVLERLWRDHGSGTFGWRELVEPAERLAEEGFPLGRLSHRTQVREYPRLVADSGLATLFLTENLALPAEGTVRARPELAATLRRLARDGPGDLYRGELASRLVRWAEGEGLPLGRRELSEAWQVEEVPAMEGSFRGWSVWAPPEPWGGEAVLRGLTALETAPEGLWRAALDRQVPWMVEALVRALATPGDDLEGWMRSLAPLPGGGATTGETTHLSVLDDRGGAVALTQTLGGAFGSGIPAADLGFVLGAAGGEAPATVPAARADSLPPGAGDTPPPPDTWPRAARLWSTPTLVARGDSMTLVLGSPGGPRSVSAVIQVVARWVRAPLALQEAVSAPRMHVGPAPGASRGRVYLEGILTDAASSVLIGAREPWSDSVRSAIADRGFLVTERDTGLQFQGVSPWFGGVNAVAWVRGRWLAAADPRRDGAGARVSETLPPADGEGRGSGGEGPPRRRP